MGITEGCQGWNLLYFPALNETKLILSAPLCFCLILVSLQPSEHSLYFPELGQQCCWRRREIWESLRRSTWTCLLGYDRWEEGWSEEAGQPRSWLQGLGGWWCLTWCEVHRGGAVGTISFRCSWMSMWRCPTGNYSKGAQDEVSSHLL